ncbi:MAG: universal stress protein [Candidatus Korobacteraceae bacterium]|jgi:nucleotide-binding universal stress UspA family protein
MEGRRHNLCFRKILVGYDGSAASERAVDVAISLAQCTDANILVLAVARPPEPATHVEVDAVLDNAKEHFEEGFTNVRGRAKAAEVHLEAMIEVGHPAEHLIHQAELNHAELIIVGRRGTSLFEKLLLGSVSERVIRFAHCPVMVVK